MRVEPSTGAATSRVRPSGRAAATVLAGLAGLHVAWGLGSSFPLASRDELADAVVGAPTVPPPVACFSVAVALAAASALAADLSIGSVGVRRAGRGVVAGVLTTRGSLGLLGRTDLLSPTSTSARFRRLDRRAYSPLCLALAAAVCSGVHRDSPERPGAIS